MSTAVILSVVGAGAIGALLRYGLSVAFAGRSGFPSAVLIVNIVGSALTGLLLALATRADIPGGLSLILVTGLCGGLTTFSTWTVETVQLFIEGHVRAAFSNVWLNLVLGVAAAAACYFVTLLLGQ